LCRNALGAGHGQFFRTGVSSAGSLYDHRSRRSPRTRMCPSAPSATRTCTRCRARGRCSGRDRARRRWVRVTRPSSGHACRRRVVGLPFADRRRFGRRRARLGRPRRTALGSRPPFAGRPISAIYRPTSSRTTRNVLRFDTSPFFVLPSRVVTNGRST